MKCGTSCVLMWWTVQWMALACRAHPREVLKGNHSEEALQRLLRVFGLESGVPPDAGHSLPPQYMLDLYRSFSESAVADRHRRRANTVRSFFDKGGSGRHHFELSNAIPDYEEVVDAEFHLFTNRRSKPSSHVIQVLLYEGSKDSSPKLLEARLVTAHASGWEVFRVTPTIKKWIAHPENNRGLTVEVSEPSGREWSDRRVHQLQNFRRPILIVFSRDPKTTPSSRRTLASIERINKNTSFQPPVTESIITQVSMEESSARNTRSAVISENGQCTRHELRVDFDKLGWSTWIISPKWYDAYVCAGACAFPLGQNQRPTNHATVQSIVHELGLTAGVGAPCCVPTELLPVSLLYFDEHTNVVLKQYDDMVAAGCGCQ